MVCRSLRMSVALPPLPVSPFLSRGHTEEAEDGGRVRESLVCIVMGIS